MNSSFQIGKVMGIPVRLHLTFLAVIPWVAYIFGQVNTQWLGRLYGFGAVEPTSTRWIYSFAFAILLFVCVGLHELGHSYVARTQGIRIRSITFYPFGGAAAMEEIPRNPRLEIRMSLAGPLISGIIGLTLILASNWAILVLGAAHPLSILLWTLGLMNLILMVFNLIPAFPMDGGRVLRAWFATKMPYVVATRNAAGIGKSFSIFLLILAIFSFNLITAIVAAFLYIAASEEEKATVLSISLEGIKVRDIMSADVHSIVSGMSLKDLMDLMFHEKHRGYPVVEDGVLKGIVTITDLQRVPDPQRETTTVGDVMTRKIYVIGPDEEASAAMKLMSEHKIRRLPVLQDGALRGIISREDLVRAIELCSECM